MKKYVVLGSCVFGVMGVPGCGDTDENDAERASVEGAEQAETPPAERSAEAARAELLAAEQAYGAKEFRHPLRAVATEPRFAEWRRSGSLPLLDVKNDENGDRFALVDGIRADERGELTRESRLVGIKRLPLRERLPRPRRQILTPGRWSDALRAELARTNPEELVEVNVALGRDYPMMTRLFEREIALGNVVNNDDARRVRKRLQADKRRAIGERQAPVAELVRKLGGKVVYSYKSSFGMIVRVPAARVAELTHPSIEALDVADLAYPNSPDWIDVRAGMQLQQYIDRNHTGEVGSDVRFAHISSWAPDDDHFAWKDGATSGSRIVDRLECDDDGCDSICDAGEPCDFPNNMVGNHATVTLGLVFGDIEDGQDPDFADLSDPQQDIDRAARSTFATESRAIVYQASIARFSVAIDHLIDSDLSNPPVGVNFSAGGVDCRGSAANSRLANEAFENDILVFAAAGNDGHSSTTTCKANNPASAIGSFAVGSQGTTSSQGEGAVRSDPICSGSARGGIPGSTAASDGSGRTIIDIAGYSPRSHAFHVDGDGREIEDGDGYSSLGCATSWATPTVLGAAIDFADYWRSDIGTSLSAGGLYTALLLFGDRQGQSGKLVSGFDNVWGAGRLKMRIPDNEGMDGPWETYIGSTCIDDGEVYQIPLFAGDPLPASADVIKAVVYWYDRRHQSSNEVDDVNLLIKRGGTFTVAGSTSPTDNKERVFVKLPSNATPAMYTMDIVGNDVTADDAGCGTNSQRVHWAYLWEDSARNDSTGPDCSIEPEEGYENSSCTVCPKFSLTPNAEFCSSSCRCRKGEGDCDSDAQCMPGLTCTHDVGADHGLPANYDICL